MCLYPYFYCEGRSLQGNGDGDNGDSDEMPNDAAFHLGLDCL